MGVKRNISLDDLKPYINIQRITPTINGISDSVFILDDKYILKIFETASKEEIENELKLIFSCADLKIPKVVSEIFMIQNKYALLYEKSKGTSPKEISKDDICSIGIFLKEFHSITKGKTSTNPKLFLKDELYKLIKKTNHQSFIELFNKIDIELKNDGIIHGDLFPDNATFLDKKLSCVFDFIQSCNGDFLFDLAVIALSWCNTKEEIIYLLESYQTDTTYECFLPYLKYAGLYYCVTRFLEKKDFSDLWNKISF